MSGACNRIGVFAGIALGLLDWPVAVHAAKYSGRATVGGFVSHERFAHESDGTYNNDFATTSSRLNARFTDDQEKRLELAADLRDKHDFYDKLSAERLELQGQNSFQVRQLSCKINTTGTGVWATVGRFSLRDAGAVNVDGAEAGARLADHWKGSIFGGLDPKLPEQKSFRWNPYTFTSGGILTYQPESLVGASSLFHASALVARSVRKHTDRFYYYDFFHYSWAETGHILTMAYLDFVPRTNVQTALISASQRLAPKWAVHPQFLAIDSEEYSRRRGILETLISSPYREGSIRIRQSASRRFDMDYFFLAGKRSADGRDIYEAALGPNFQQLGRPDLSGSLAIGYRKNFTSKDKFLKFGLGYYPKNWELVLDEQLALQKSDRVLHLANTELSLARYITRELYAAGSLQYAYTELAQALGAFVYVGYRFGSRDLPPLRDGAPPRWRL